MTLVTQQQKQPLVVELLGAAGSGKTTIGRMLSSQYQHITLGVNSRLTDCVPFLARDSHLLVPFLHRGYRSSRFFRWYEARCMVRLTAWQRRLRLEPRQSGDIVLLDHGPIFKLVRLREFGPEFVNSIAYQKWWERILQQWCDTLDVVIWLDAPDDVLLERIQARSTEHRMKEKAPVEAFEFLSHYRTCYQRIVDNCVSKGNPLVLRCDTERDTLDQTVTRILAMLDQIRTGMEVKTHVA